MSLKAVVFHNIRIAPDAELVVTAIAGGEAGFEELVRRYQRPIASYVYRMLGDYEASLDVTQEVFIKVYNSLDRYSSDYKFSTWLYRIAHNAAIDHLRRKLLRRIRASCRRRTTDMPLGPAATAAHSQGDRAVRTQRITRQQEGISTVGDERIATTAAK